MEKVLEELRALLEGAAKLMESGETQNAIGLIYIALDKIDQI